MPPNASRTPALGELYQQYLVDQDTAAFIRRTTERYSVATLGRLISMGDRSIRRAAVLAMGYVADYESNAVLGRAMSDVDRGVRLLAETAIRSVWCRVGTAAQRKQLGGLIILNRAHQFEAALREATSLIHSAPWLAEVWNQRAIAQFGLGHFEQSVQDCRQALEINPYHFGAAAGMGQCALRMGDQRGALEAFRRALGLNPELEGIRANIQVLERAQKRSS